MIKDIIVNLSIAPARDVAGDFAVSIAAALQAHVAAVAFVYEPVVATPAIGTIPAEVLESLRREKEDAAKAAIARFDGQSKRMGLSAESRAIGATLVGAADVFGRMARRFDLAVVGQAEPDRLAPEELLIEGALFASGRPVIIVPYIQRSGLKLDRVMICWDGSRNAARAIADAMPLLVKAREVEVAMFVDEPAKSDEVPGADIAHHLARHGLRVEVHRLFSGGTDIASAILSRAADCSADFIVMGGYGHSRVREFILGGATRGILTSMTVPVLMSH